MAKPCLYCTKLIKKAVAVYGFNIKKITYSLDNGEFESCSVQNLHTTHISSGSKAILSLYGKYKYY